MHKFLSVLVLSLLCSSAIAQHVYQWTDDRGVVQYGQRPPVDGRYQQIDIKTAPPPGGAVRKPAPQPEPQTDTATNEASQAERRQAQREREKQRLAACAQTRKNLETLLNNPRLRRTNADGEVERIGEDERQQLILHARDRIEQDCT